MTAIQLSDEEIQDFKIEAAELLDSAEEGLLKIESGAPFLECYDAIFRVFHSLKGGAGMLGMEALQGHMHQLETLFSDCKALGKIEKNQITFFLQGADAARKILEGVDVQFDFDTPNKTESLSSGSGATSREPVAKKTIIPKTDGLLIYVADDESDLLTTIKEILEVHGLTCCTFLDPVELINEVKRRPPDVVLTDYNMPQKTGVEVLREVKAIDPEIPVIFLSGFLTTESLIEAIQNGIFAAIEKPFKNSDVVAQCTAAARHSKVNRLFNRSVNLLMYQFSDLDAFLVAQGKEDVRKALLDEMNSIMAARREIRGLVRAASKI